MRRTSIALAGTNWAIRVTRVGIGFAPARLDGKPAGKLIKMVELRWFRWKFGSIPARVLACSTNVFEDCSFRLADYTFGNREFARSNGDIAASVVFAPGRTGRICG